MKLRMMALGIVVGLAGLLQAETAPILRIGIDEDYMPWENWVDNQAVGINVDIVSKVCQELGFTPKFIKLPFKRILAFLESGEIDLAGGLEPSPERMAYIQFLKPAYQPTIKIFLADKSAGLDVNTYEKLREFTVGVRRGNKQFEPFDSDTRIKKHEGDSDEQLLNMLLASPKRLDLLVGSYTQLLYSAKQLGLLDKVKIMPYTVDKGMSGQFGLSLKSPLLSRKADIEQVLSTMQKNGQIRAIIDSQVKK